MSQNLTSQEIMSLVSEIASAYIASHETQIEEIPQIVRQVFTAVVEVSRSASNVGKRTSLTPAVPVEESVHDDYIVCLEDGKKLQMLKRHLSTVYGLTIDQYKDRWGLPSDYPVVSPNYAKRRSAIAKTTGLGNVSHRKLSKVA